MPWITTSDSSSGTSPLDSQSKSGTLPIDAQRSVSLRVSARILPSASTARTRRVSFRGARFLDGFRVTVEILPGASLTVAVLNPIALSVALQCSSEVSVSFTR